MTAAERSCQGPAHSLQMNIMDMLGGGQCGQFYVTHELQKQLHHVGDAVDHIKLDDQFLTTSKVWRDRFNQDALAAEKTGEV